jgi:ribokinase
VETIPGCETCLGIIFVGPEGQRAILATLGAHALMDVAVARRHDAAVRRCAEVVLCGSYLLPALGPSQVLPYARELRARGQTVVFDPSWDPGGWSEATRRDTLALLDEVDVYLPNEPELIHLTGASDLESAIAALGGKPRELVVKCGADGALLVADGQWIPVVGHAVAAVNTIGAGDVFDVAYLYARRLGWLPAERLRFACALAAMVVAQSGARTYPDAAAVAAFRKEADRDTRIHV